MEGDLAHQGALDVPALRPRSGQHLVGPQVLADHPREALLAFQRLEDGLFRQGLERVRAGRRLARRPGAGVAPRRLGEAAGEVVGPLARHPLARELADPPLVQDGPRPRDADLRGLQLHGRGCCGKLLQPPPRGAHEPRGHRGRRHSDALVGVGDGPLLVLRPGAPRGVRRAIRRAPAGAHLPELQKPLHVFLDAQLELQHGEGPPADEGGPH
mmetsp:Transcript_124499/g.387656  ORF Transcript_124499/g.387656 Transcript_124499/m.387656 type:complete len:213 (+) Transcript_124499:475-1113(+)